MKLREIYWFMGVLVYLLLMDMAILGFQGFSLDAVFDINVHDTYYVIKNSHLLIFLGIVFFFAVYFVRMLSHRFKNNTVNVVFILSGIGVLGLLSLPISFSRSMQEIPGVTEYPPLSGGTVEKTGNIWNMLFYVFRATQIVMLLFLLFVAVKTGINLKNRNN